MRSLILCEGFDDVLILGYYLFKTQGWKFNPKGVFAKLYSFPKVDFKRQAVEIYERDEARLGIWAVGGKDSFDEAYKFICQVNQLNPTERIDKVFIVTDRDQSEVEKCLWDIQNKMNVCGLEVGELKNNQVNRYFYEVEEETYRLEIIPVVVPFDRNGAIESVLMEGIAETGEEEEYIVRCANNYIMDVLNSGRLHNYLQHDRQVLKAKLSAVISITNPDRSTNLFDKVLMSWNWETKKEVRRHFEKIVECLEQ